MAHTYTHTNIKVDLTTLTFALSTAHIFANKSESGLSVCLSVIARFVYELVRSAVRALRSEYRHEFIHSKWSLCVTRLSTTSDAYLRNGGSEAAIFCGAPWWTTLRPGRSTLSPSVAAVVTPGRSARRVEIDRT